MSFLFPGAYPHQNIHLTFDTQLFRDPGFVLVYAFYEQKLLFTHHRLRGWELPGGTRNIGEWPIMTAIREVYEETGAELASLKPIGQYIISYPDQAQQIKTIYIAQVQRLHTLPAGFETDNIQLANPPPSADEIIADASFSPLLKDGVYRFSLPIALAAMTEF